MKATIAAALVFASVPVYAQMSGVSHPDSTVITSDENTPAPAKPSAAITSATPTPAPAADTYGPYVPYTGPTVPGASVAASDLPTGDVDGQIVESVPEIDGQLREGTLLRAKITSALSTTSTVEGSLFTAELTDPIERNGRIILPAGAILEGRVTEVHSGKRITGAAALHLETKDILLPDGTHYVVHAQLVDVDNSNYRIDGEGTLKRKDHVKEELAIAGGVTGAGAVSGALIGGGVGAVVGAGIGAGISTVMWLKADRQASLPKDQSLVFSLTVPMILTPLSPTEPATLATRGGTQ